jgi:hypothetical protein
MADPTPSLGEVRHLSNYFPLAICPKLWEAIFLNTQSSQSARAFRQEDIHFAQPL